MQPSSKGNINKFIVAGIIGALAVGIAYGAVGGAFSSVTPPAVSNEPQNGRVIMHIHATLHIIVEGKSVTIPANIGINPELYKSHDLDAYGMKNPSMSPLHMHDSSGVIHVESTEVRPFTLGEFFDVWGVAFSEDCIMDKCSNGTDKVRMYVDGKERNDFRQHVFMDGEEIEIIMMQMVDRGS